jgi:uncharacterized membrane protein
VNLRSWPQRYWASFSYVGLALATLFFAASLTPSLLPRHYATQGLLSGFALATGYGVGVLFVWTWLYLEIPRPGERRQRTSKRITTAVVAVVAATFLWRAAVWQDSIRDLMEMEPVQTAYPLHVGGIAIVTAIVLVALARAIGQVFRWLDGQVKRVAPPRVSRLISGALVIVLVILIVNDVIARALLNASDAMFRGLDRVVDENIEQPTSDLASGGPESLVEWDTIGRWGKDFVAAGPTQEEIAELLGRAAEQPLRVYVGLNSRDDVDERAQLALDELIRVGGFERSVLVVATPTGTGWLDPGAVDTLEYLHAGDTAIVSMQYSYLPSWMTILVDPVRSVDMARELFDVVYAHWKTLPKDERPKLYLFGLSLGALGSAASADLFTVFEDPIHGGVWSGPPFPSAVWSRAVAAREPDSPMWLPRFRDGSMIRFTGRESSIDQAGSRWGPMRFVYIQHASDPMVFFSPNLAWRRPAWLDNPRGPDVSPHLGWLPIVTFLQLGFDLPMATTPPAGYGHNYAPSSYIDAWVAVTDPSDWTPELTEQVKRRFAGPRE